MPIPTSLPLRLACVILAASSVASLARAADAPSRAGTMASGGVTAVPVVEFLGSIGTQSAISRRGEDLAHTIACGKYLGIRWLRSGFESGLPVADLLTLHARTGIRFSYGLMSGGSDLKQLLAGARILAAADALLAFEGTNEPNNFGGVTYKGIKGGGNRSWLAVAKLQRDLYAQVKADPKLKRYPVWSISENGAEVDNVGLQFLTIPAGAHTLMPSGTTYADCANCHNYLEHPGWPGWHDNQAWMGSDPGPGCRLDGLFGNYGTTWSKHFQGYTAEELTTLPRVTTETGRTIAAKTTEAQQASLFLDFYLSQFKRGWNHTAFYLMRDRVDEAGNQAFGFYKPDYKPRASGTALHNFTTILDDTGSVARPGRLAYTIARQPVTTHDLLLEKSDGTFVLVLWAERFASPGDDEIDVGLGRSFPTVRIFDPTTGVDPVQTLHQVGTVHVSLSDHPLLIELPVGK